MSKKTFEMASAYVAIMPSLEGLHGELSDQINKALPGADRALSRGLGDTFSNVGGQASKSLVGSLASGVNKIGDSIFKGIGSSLSKAGGLLANTLTTGIGAAVGTVGAGITAVLGKAASGGFTRALGLNKADARLSALGYNAEKVADIMKAAGDAIDGTAYAMDESVGTATQLLSAGITDTGKLQQALENVAKLSDISGTSFADMGTIFAKNAASGKVQYADLVQLMNHQIPIMSELSKAMGVPVDQVREMASAGKISFQDFQDAVEQINFDSVIYASKDVGMAWRNVVSQLSKTGAIIWEPIVDGLAPVLNIARQALIDFRDNPAVKNLTEGVTKSLERTMEGVQSWAGGIGNVIGSKTKFSEIITDWIKKIKEFRESFKGVEGLVLGLGAALSSGFLSKIPVIGSVFGGVSLGVGALGGTLLQLYRDSDKLSSSISNLGRSIKSALGGLDFSNIFDTKKIGDSLSGVVDSISNLIRRVFVIDDGVEFDFNISDILVSIIDKVKTFVDVLTPYVSTVKEIVSGIADAFAGVFSKGAGIGDLAGALGLDSFATIADQLRDNKVEKAIGAFVANISTALEALPSVLQLVLEIGSGFMAAIGTIATSEITNSILGFIVKVIDWLAESGLGPKIGVAMGALYAVNKLSPVLKLVGSGFSKIGGSLFGGGAAQAGKAISEGIKGFFEGLKGIVGGASSTIKAIIEGAGEIVKAILEFLKTIVDSLGPVVESVGSLIQTIFKELGLIAEAIVKALAGIGKAVMQAIPELLALGVFILAIGALIWALDQMGVFGILKQIALDMVEVFSAIAEAIAVVIERIAGILEVHLNGILTVLSIHWPFIKDVLDFIKETFIEVLSIILDTIVEIGSLIIEGIIGLVEAMGESFALVIDSVGGLLESLAENGGAAGLGALEASVGILALAAALVALTASDFVNTLAGLGSGLLEGLGNLFGIDSGGLSGLIESAKILKEFSEEIDQMPSRWEAVGSQAFEAGSRIMDSFSQGLLNGLKQTEARLMSDITNMMSRLQSRVNSTPINMRVSTSGVGASSSSYTTNNNYSIKTSNSSVAKSLIDAARGARRF